MRLYLDGNMLNKVALAASKQKLFTVYKCFGFKISNGFVKIAATDGHKLIVFSRPLNHDDKVDDGKEFVLDLNGAINLKDIKKRTIRIDSEDYQKFNIYTSSDTCTTICGYTGTFPNYDAILNHTLKLAEKFTYLSSEDMKVLEKINPLYYKELPLTDKEQRPNSPLHWKELGDEGMYQIVIMPTR